MCRMTGGVGLRSRINASGAGASCDIRSKDNTLPGSGPHTSPPTEPSKGLGINSHVQSREPWYQGSMSTALWFCDLHKKPTTMGQTVAVAIVPAEEGSSRLVPALQIACGAGIFALSSMLVVLMPTHQRPLPGQTIDVLGTHVFIRAAENDHPFIADLDSHVPSAWMTTALIISPIVMLAVTQHEERLVALGAWCMAMSTNELLSELIKRFCGFMRPNFYGGCGWDAETGRCTRDFPDGRHSFPSGHSSNSAAMATVIAIVALRSAEHRPAEMVRGAVLRLVAAVVWLLAAYVAATRVRDNWHHPADVIAGASLGAATAAAMVRLTWPRPAPIDDAGQPMMLW